MHRFQGLLFKFSPEEGAYRIPSEGQKQRHRFPTSYIKEVISPSESVQIFSRTDNNGFTTDTE